MTKERRSFTSHGGKRPGAGRPPHPYKTVVMRIPKNLTDAVKTFIGGDLVYRRPLFSSKVQAGFPSPADDHQEAELDLNTHIIKHPAATFFVRVAGNSMTGAGIYPGDILVVDKSLPVSNGRIIVAIVNGEFTVKRYSKNKNKILLLPENPDFQPIDVTNNTEFQVWGVVKTVIHDV